MGTSTNGQICCGIVFDEDAEFPWTECDDTDDWWLDECGYIPPFKLFDDAGNYLNGREPSREECAEYFRYRTAFMMTHPMPFELVNYCSGDYPRYVLAIPGSVITAHRGDPAVIDPTAIAVGAQEQAAFYAFCEKYGFEGTAQWLLTSYWG